MPCSVEYSCYKIPYRGWPEWIKSLIRIEDRRIKREAKYGEEIPVDPIVLEEMLSDEGVSKELGYFTIPHQIDHTPYYQTSRWYMTRNKILDRDSFTCVDCGSTNRLDVHHLHYKNFGNENMEDLITLCRECHGKRHGYNE